MAKETRGVEIKKSGTEYLSSIANYTARGRLAQQDSWNPVESDGVRGSLHHLLFAARDYMAENGLDTLSIRGVNI